MRDLDKAEGRLLRGRINWVVLYPEDYRREASLGHRSGVRVGITGVRRWGQWSSLLSGQSYTVDTAFAHRGLVWEHRRLSKQINSAHMGGLDSFPVLKVSLPSRWNCGSCGSRKADGHGCGHQWHVRMLTVKYTLTGAGCSSGAWLAQAH